MYFKRIKQLRLNKELTQKAVADLIGCSQQTYSDYETGKYDIPNEILIKLADFYKVSTDYILDRKNNKKINY